MDRIDSIPIRKLFFIDTIDGVEEISSPPYRIPPYEYKSILAINWQEKINSCPDSTLKIFVISEQIMRTKSWEEIWKNQLVYQKVEFKYTDVAKNFGVIRISGTNIIH